MFDIAITFADRESHIGHARIVLEVEKLLGTSIGIFCGRYPPEWFQCVHWFICNRRHFKVVGIEAARSSSGLAGRLSVLQAGFQRPVTIHCAGGKTGLRGHAWHEAMQFAVPCIPGSGL